MALQIIICVESDKRARTDNIYIKETLDRFYDIGKDININFINMGGKSKYNSKDVKKEIKNLKKQFLIGETVVIYCIDTDQFEKNYEHELEFKSIISYVESVDAECIWFCHDVEEVYIGKSISKGNKKDEAMNFKKKGCISEVDELMLKSARKVKSGSNILQVFDKYLVRVK